jgi:effector-binding domain-containing protein
MIDTPQVVHTEAQLTAVIRLVVPRSEIQKVMGPAIGEVMATLAAQRVAPAGPVFSRHFRMDPGAFDFEVGVPVATPVSASGRVQASSLPSATVVRTIYHGPYEGLGEAWGGLEAWMAAQGHTPRPDLWELYVLGPESSADASTWCTELNRPIIS